MTLRVRTWWFVAVALTASLGDASSSPSRAINDPVPVKLNRIPDTAEIVYHTHGFIYTMDHTGGGVTRITRENPRHWEHVAVSHDRRFVVANEVLPNPKAEPGGKSRLWLFDLERGTEARLVPEFASAGNGGVAWDSEGFIYFAAKEKDIVPNPQRPEDFIRNAAANDVYRVRHDGAGLARLGATTDAGEADVGVSPDGSLVSYIKQVINLSSGDHTEVWVMNRDGGNARRIYVGGITGKESVHDPEVSPDNKRVAFSKVNPAFKNFPSNPAANTAHDIYVVNLDGRDLRRLTQPGPISIIPNWRDNLILYTEINESGQFLGASTVRDSGIDQTPTRVRRDVNAPNWIPGPRTEPPYRSWGSDKRLTFDPGSSQLSVNFAWSVAADEAGRVHVVWYDDRDGVPQIYYKRSLDRGATWTADTRLSHDPAPKEHPAIAVSGSSVYVVWHDLRNRNLDIYFKRSLDGGHHWEPEDRLSIRNPGGSAHASIAASGTGVYVVWGDHRDGEQAEIYFRSSFDGGATWGDEVRVSELTFDSWVPTVAAAGRNVYVAWVDTGDGNEEEYFRGSTDGGLTWGPLLRLTDHVANSWAPSIAAVGGTVHLVWFDQQDSPVQPLEAESKLNEAMELLGLKYEPAPSGVVVINPEEAAGRRATEKLQLIASEAAGWVKRGGDAARLQAILKEFEEMGKRGASYMAKERKLDEALKLMELTYAPGPQDDLPKVYYTVALAMRVQDKLQQIQSSAPEWVQRGGDPVELETIINEFYSMLEAASSEWEIYYKRSTDGGVSWGPVNRLTNAPGPSARPSIAALGEQLSVVWFDGRNGNAEVYYKESLDRGLTWSADDRLTDAMGDSVHPSVALSADRVHVVWFDQRDGNSEIYYTRSRLKRERGRMEFF